MRLGVVRAHGGERTGSPEHRATATLSRFRARRSVGVVHAGQRYETFWISSTLPVRIVPDSCPWNQPASVPAVIGIRRATFARSDPRARAILKIIDYSARRALRLCCPPPYRHEASGESSWKDSPLHYPIQIVDS